MANYYDLNLSADRLKRCYEIAPKRIKQYLKAEFDFVISFINRSDTILDLGCGYGRTLASLSAKSKDVAGLDSSFSNLTMAQALLEGNDQISLVCGNAGQMPFSNNKFDLTLCIQNGISAFHINPEILLNESTRVTKPNGTILFSTYSDKIWDDRLDWFELQAAEGLLGEIDYNKTGNGEIVCKDGFTATTFNEINFRKLTSTIKADIEITEIDQSSLFCVICNLKK